jgi:hypothetical protein
VPAPVFTTAVADVGLVTVRLIFVTLETPEIAKDGLAVPRSACPR